MENVQEANEEVKCIGNHALLVDNMPCDRGIKELMQNIDSRRMLAEYCQEKFKNKSQLIDLEARCQFHGATKSAIKCMLGCNHYGERHSSFNQNLPSNRCPRCGEIETWHHIATCRTLSDQNSIFLQDLEGDLNKQAQTEQQKSANHNIINDLRKFMLNMGNKHDANQQIIGWQNVFRGFVVKRLKDECKEDYFNKIINRILVKKCMSYCIECWFERNEHFHDPEKKKQHVLEWTRKLERRILTSNKVNAIRCLQSNRV